EPHPPRGGARWRGAPARARAWRGLHELFHLHAEGFLARETDLPVAVDVDHLDEHLVALLDDVGHLLHALLGELGDVHEAVDAGEDLDERPELRDALHRAQVELADLRLPRAPLAHSTA